MPLHWLRTIDGERLPLTEIDPVLDAPRLGGSPATVAMVLRSSVKRTPLGDTFSASMVDKPARQLFLEQTVPFSKRLGDFMAAELGTMKHDLVNVPTERIIANVRVWSQRFPWLSGELDNAAIVDVVETESEVTFVLDLYDLKTGGWYGAKTFHKNPFGDKSGYAWQVNCLATLLEEQVDGDAISAIGGVCVKPLVTWIGKTWRIQVRRLFIEWPPRDTSWRDIAEAKKVGIADPNLVLIEVPRKPADEVYAQYEAARAAQLTAREQNYADVCAETWWNDRAQKHLRCEFYCPVEVREACIQMSHAAGKSHHLAPLDVALKASIEQAEAANA